MDINETVKVFIIDDDEMYLKILKDKLSSLRNIEVYTFLTGEEGLSALHLKPNLILLDYHLNSIEENAKNGIQILEDIIQKSPDSIVYMLTGVEQIDIAHCALNGGAADYLLKSKLSVEDISSKINKLKLSELKRILAIKQNLTHRWMIINIIVFVLVVVASYLVSDSILIIFTLGLFFLGIGFASVHYLNTLKNKKI